MDRGILAKWTAKTFGLDPTQPPGLHWQTLLLGLPEEAGCGWLTQLRSYLPVLCEELTVAHGARHPALARVSPVMFVQIRKRVKRTIAKSTFQALSPGMLNPARKRKTHTMLHCQTKRGNTSRWLRRKMRILHLKCSFSMRKSSTTVSHK